MGNSATVAEAFAKLGELGCALGVKNINKLPACWEFQIDEQWWIAVNAHHEEMKCSTGDPVPSFHAYIKYNGWPAGLIYPGGGIIAAGECANEDTFIEAIDNRIAKEKSDGNARVQQ